MLRKNNWHVALYASEIALELTLRWWREVARLMAPKSQNHVSAPTRHERALLSSMPVLSRADRMGGDAWQ
jgi:hypothetical protein